MNSFTNYYKNNKIINPDKLLSNKKKNYSPTNHSNISNEIIFSYNSKNKSRNNKTNLMLLTESNSNEKTNNTKNINTTNNTNTSNNSKFNSNLGHIFSNITNKKTKKIKKNYFKKKLKELFDSIKIENIDNKKIIFQNKRDLLDRIKYDKIKIPRIKTQIGLNNYLINDFKESESPFYEISRSLKNRLVYDEYKFLKTLLQEQKCLYNLYNPKDYRPKYSIKNDNNSSFNNESNSNNLIKPYIRKNKKRFTTYNPVVIYKNLYKNMHIRKSNEKIFNENNKINYSNKGKRKSFLFHTSLLSSHSKEKYPIISSNRFITEFQNSLSSQKYKKKYSIHSVRFNLEKEKDSSLSSPPKDILPFSSSIRLQSNLRKSFSHNINNSNSDTKLNISNYYNKSKNNRIKKNYKLTFKERYSNESNIRYINELNNYLAKAQKLKKEHSEGDNRKARLIKLDENKLILEIKKKKKKNKTVMDSFGVKRRNNDDDELNFESYKDAKKFHIDMGMGSFYMNNLKMKIVPRYIKKEFKKETTEKYKGNNGIFFGTEEKIEDLIKKKI
jgi:hypothetical protein